MPDDKPFRIVEKLQKFNEDITKEQLRYHRKRVMVAKEFTFDAAHHLHCYEGKCKNLHGHTYKLVVGISGYPDEIGMIVDFGDIKDMYKKFVESKLDHRYLNEVLPPMNTTAENMAVWIYEQLERALEEYGYLKKGIRMEFVRLYETPTSYAEITREWMEE